MADAVFREDLDDESYQVREVFAQFGLTSYAAQVMERGVINLLAMFANTHDPEASRRRLGSSTNITFDTLR